MLRVRNDIWYDSSALRFCGWWLWTRFANDDRRVNDFRERDRGADLLECAPADEDDEGVSEFVFNDDLLDDDRTDEEEEEGVWLECKRDATGSAALVLTPEEGEIGDDLDEEDGGDEDGDGKDFDDDDDDDVGDVEDGPIILAQIKSLSTLFESASREAWTNTLWSRHSNSSNTVVKCSICWERESREWQN